MIDDDPSVLDVVSRVLLAIGYDCQTAPDGQSGLRRFDEGGWDLVLTDLAMPGLHGWDVVAEIRRRAPSMPIVVVTGVDDPAVITRACEWRVPVVAKPFQLETLKGALVEALYAKPT
jgi:two-component system, NtrC family, response regulator AtoC